MKVRSGFVSNSSSASFIIDKRYITTDQIEKIKEFNNSKKCWDYWSISEDDEFLRGYTTMDNDYLYEWIKENINLPMKAIVSWECDG